MVWDNADSSSSSPRQCCSSPVHRSTSPGKPVYVLHLGDSGAMNQGTPVCPSMQWRLKGVPDAHRLSPNEVVAEGPFGPAAVGLRCTALHCRRTDSAAPVRASQVDGRGILQGGTGRVIPRVLAPDSVLSC